MVMHYAPHTLWRLTAPTYTADALGRPVAEGTERGWVRVCRCRMDVTSVSEVTDDNGTVLKEDCHVVCEGNAPGVSAGDTVRIMLGDITLQEGKVIRHHKLNSLGYAEIWL